MSRQKILMNNRNVRYNNNGLLLLRHSFYWFCFCLFLVFEIKLFGNFFLQVITRDVFPKLLLYLIECSILCVAAINAIYCLISYIMIFYKIFAKQLIQQSSKHNTRLDSSGISCVDLNESRRNDCVRSLCTFVGNFFKLTLQTTAQKDLNLSLSNTVSELDLKDTSMSSLVGYHDSPMNKSVASVHTNKQLWELLDNETCDSVVDASDCTVFFTKDFPDCSGIGYRVGTTQSISLKSDTSINGIKSFVFEREKTESITIGKRRPDRRIYHHRSFSSSDSKQKLYVETNIKEILKLYGLNESEMETLELKLRIWICNTIMRPLVEKIDELNIMLTEKHSNMHIRIGQSPIEMLKITLAHRTDLCNTMLPFVLPYLHVHNNQSYVVNRLKTLTQNIALEDFKWNSGEDLLVQDEKNEITRISSWNEQLPSDTELIWHMFCTYMDFHLSPSSNAVTALTEFSKPFTNVYFVKSTTDCLPLAFDKKISEVLTDEQLRNRYFIRMTTTNPPCFELILDGGETVILPLKDTSFNFWLVLILFLAHIKKYSHHRIGHVHIATLSLDIFDI